MPENHLVEVVSENEDVSNGTAIFELTNNRVLPKAGTHESDAGHGESRQKYASKIEIPKLELGNINVM